MPTNLALASIKSTGSSATRTFGARFADVKNVKDFGAVGDGVTNDYAAFAAAVAALPTAGGTIIVPDSVGYKLNTTVTDGGKPVRFLVGHTTITGPASGFIFDLTTNGSTFEGSGRKATILKLTAPTAAPVMPTVTTTLTADAVTGTTITGAGSNLHSTPLTEVSNSPTERDAALIATEAAGVLSSIAIVAAGSGYVGAPTVSFIGGGAGAIKSNEVQYSTLRGFSVDMSSIPNAVGVYHYGGWYADFSEIFIDPTTVHASAISLLIDSHTLGVPGPTGSYGGVYVGRFSNIYASKVAIIGHDISTATTLMFETLDCANIFIHGAIAVTFINPVIQGSTGSFLDLVNADGVTLIGGDMEGSAQIIKAHGSCSNVKILGVLAYSATGDVIYGPFGAGWILEFSKTNSADEPLRTGSAGAAGYAFQNTGWNIKHHFGVHYSGDTMVYSSNIKLLSATTGNLDDTGAAGFAMYMNTSGQMIIKYANAGANPVSLIEIAKFDGGGLTVRNAAALIKTAVALNNGAGVGAGTITNAPAAGNPTKWIPIDDNGTTRYIPAW